MGTVDTVRLLIADLATDPAEQLLSDVQIQALLDLNNDSVRRAAADALDTIATSEVLVSKKIQTQDLSTDGAAVAAELRARSAVLRAQADAQDSSDAGDDFAFEVFDTIGMTGRPELTEWRQQVWGL